LQVDSFGVSDNGPAGLHFLDLLVRERVEEEALLDLRDGVDVLELALAVPVFVEEIVVAPQLLSDLTHQMQVLFGLIPRDVEVWVVLVQDFHPDQPLSSHYCLHKPEVEAPDHYNTKDDCQGSHHDPVLDPRKAEAGLGRQSIVDVTSSYVCSDCIAREFFVFMLLLQKGIEEQGALGKAYQ